MKGHPYSHCPSLPSRPRSRSSPPSPLGCSLFVVLFFFVPFLPAAAPRSSFTCKIRLNFPPLRKEGRKEGRTDGRNQAGKQRSKERNPSISPFFKHSSTSFVVVVVVVATSISIVTQFSPLSHVIAATSCVLRRSNCRRAFLSDRSVFVPHSWSSRTASPILWEEEENISRRW